VDTASGFDLGAGGDLIEGAQELPKEKLTAHIAGI
jgi:hypothetical protein